MSAPANDPSAAELTQLAERLGQAVADGGLARAAAIGELLDQAAGGLTPVGAAEMIDHWDIELPAYADAFTELVGTVADVAAMPAADRVEHGRRLLWTSLISPEIEHLGQEVEQGRQSRDDAVAALRNRSGFTLSSEDAGRLVDGWVTVRIRHSRALRFLVHLYDNTTFFQPQVAAAELGALYPRPPAN
jgi:hypothetical protein